MPIRACPGRRDCACQEFRRQNLVLNGQKENGKEIILFCPIKGGNLIFLCMYCKIYNIPFYFSKTVSDIVDFYNGGLE
jgi:hypothetical protein